VKIGIKKLVFEIKQLYRFLRFGLQFVIPYDIMVERIFLINFFKKKSKQKINLTVIIVLDLNSCINFETIIQIENVINIQKNFIFTYNM